MSHPVVTVMWSLGEMELLTTSRKEVSFSSTSMGKLVQRNDGLRLCGQVHLLPFLANPIIGPSQLGFLHPGCCVRPLGFLQLLGWFGIGLCRHRCKFPFPAHHNEIPSPIWKCKHFNLLPRYKFAYSNLYGQYNYIVKLQASGLPGIFQFWKAF